MSDKIQLTGKDKQQLIKKSVLRKQVIICKGYTFCYFSSMKLKNLILC